MNTTHKIQIGAAQFLDEIEDNSVQLVVTSPPYPMIEMWDEIFSKQNKSIGDALNNNQGNLAFELMHQELDKVWKEIHRVLSPGCFACINIGDATRTINGDFSLYPNHSRIISSFISNGFSNLPNILWRKQTNAPNKFMGSGMLPAGAYVTLEHEWIIIFRKGGKRILKTEKEKRLRRESAFFWEERNCWFSDLWDFKGIKQKINNSATRERSAAFPFELPYRLINMYSLKGDTVLDPFLGSATTTIASLASQRNSIGIEIDPMFLDLIKNNIESVSIGMLNDLIQNRISQHDQFITSWYSNPEKKQMKHFNKNLNIPVMTSQETEIQFSFLNKILMNSQEVIANYSSTRSDKLINEAKSKQILIGY